MSGTRRGARRPVPLPLEQRRLSRVHRLRFELDGGIRSLIVKRLPPTPTTPDTAEQRVRSSSTHFDAKVVVASLLNQALS